MNKTLENQTSVCIENYFIEEIQILNKNLNMGSLLSTIYKYSVIYLPMDWKINPWNSCKLLPQQFFLWIKNKGSVVISSQIFITLADTSSYAWVSLISSALIILRI